METRKDSLSALKLCRFCLCEDKSLTSLYDRSRTSKNVVPLSLKILSCVSIEVFPSDKMPSFICKRCRYFMDICYEYKQVCRQADETILQFIQNGTALQSIPFPLQLCKAFQNAMKSSSEPAVVKTVVEGGATVEVTSQDVSDSDEDDENMYIKIENSNKNVSTIKLETSNNDELDDLKLQPVNKDSERVASSVKSSGEGKTWACDECYCNYPLQQLLELHKNQRHRPRNVACDQCDAKFFTKYDLATHQLRHLGEMPFQCVACDRQFRRLVLLKRHEKTMHADIPQLPCPNCPASFLSHEEYEAHQKKHSRIAERRHICMICDKKFHVRSSLQRHIEVVHYNKPGYRCEYCTERFSSVSKLTKHVRSHASERAYPCKYCDKSFIKSHHYTRHLRLKHREGHSTARGQFGQTEQYRCEQCEDIFTTQDELIYHSAIHATQNLTCPLCQEKFENVDAVTSHIKSHVNGVEFMCDLCELVFTSKEKLDSHITMAHDDELQNSEDMVPDESSMEMDAEDDDDDEAINVKEEDDHMVVEIKKTDGFIISGTPAEPEEKINHTNSEESETEATYAELATVDTLAMARKEVAVTAAEDSATIAAKQAAAKPQPKAEKNENRTVSILRKAEEIKRKVQNAAIAPKVTSKEKITAKAESSNIAGASDKTLRLLEKELQELKRTNVRNETTKTVTKTTESLRTRRPQIHTSTPKQRPAEEKKMAVLTKSPAMEKKLPERKAVTKENKEPKETKEVKGNNTSMKEEKEKEVKEKDVKEKEKETPKSIVKNGDSDKSGQEETVRRSTRPSKIKDYAKMIRDKTQETDEDDSDMDDEEYNGENRTRVKRNANKPPSKPLTPGTATPATPARKRGRPRKEPLKEVPNKIKKEESSENDTNPDKNEDSKSSEPAAAEKESSETKNEEDVKSQHENEPKSPAGVLVSPTGQTLKKVPVRALPPGVKPLPLPANARPMGPGELCEMQIGKKMVKVQKIVMTKAEVEAMAKKGLVEMKDGTMVLKQGIKIPTADAVAIKSTLVGDKEIGKDSNLNKESTPSDGK